jgi:cytochrome oxidase Cu insertion factor (SCO1/SenC/PrrC family)
LTKSTRHGLIAFVAALVIIIGGFAYRQFGVPADEAVRAPLSIGGPFTLVDASGANRRDTDFRGKLMLVYFGYTFCPDICPTTLTMMSDTLAKLGASASEIAPIFITVDPARDTPAQMKQYMGSFDPRFVALTGSPAQVAAAASAYRVYYRKVSGDAGQYTMDHSSIIYLMARDGRYLGHFDSTITADNLARALKKYL